LPRIRGSERHGRVFGLRKAGEAYSCAKVSPACAHCYALSWIEIRSILEDIGFACGNSLGDADVWLLLTKRPENIEKMVPWTESVRVACDSTNWRDVVSWDGLPQIAK